MHQYTLDELMNAQPKTRKIDWSTSAAAAASVDICQRTTSRSCCYAIQRSHKKTVPKLQTAGR